MTRYSKRVREEAAMVCAISASNGDLEQAYGEVVRRMFGDEARIHGRDSFELAFAAWRRTQYEEHPDAEAEALIRTGWSPP